MEPSAHSLNDCSAFQDGPAGIQTRSHSDEAALGGYWSSELLLVLWVYSGLLDLFLSSGLVLVLWVSSDLLDLFWSSRDKIRL